MGIMGIRGSMGRKDKIDGIDRIDILGGKGRMVKKGRRTLKETKKNAPLGFTLKSRRDFNVKPTRYQRGGSAITLESRRRQR